MILVIAGARLHAQLHGTVDVGASSVQYDGYLAAGALYVNPTLRYNTPDLSLGLQGSGVVFETGNHILQGTVAGAWRSPRFGRWRTEVSGSGGVTSYASDEADYPTYGHGIGRLRLHYAAQRAGAWVGGAAGHSFFGENSDVPIEVGGGAWIAATDFAANGRVVHTWLGDSSYLDVSTSLRWAHRRIEATGTAGFRAASTGGGSGAWAEGSVQVAIAGPVAALLAGGRYPSNPVRGVLAATYVSAGVRITLLHRSRQERTPSVERRPAAATAGLPTLRVEEAGADSVALVISATGVTRVELVADFTDWEAVRLDPASDGTWLLRTALPRGIYRLNVRVDGGPWLVPAGYAHLDDDFGGSVALLVIP
jgi:hypothetical protein